MNNRKYKWILYIIVLVILGTISIQVYWNYKNYLINKQQLINDVQISLDNAVDSYYTNLAKKSTIGFAFEANSEEDYIIKSGRFDSVLNHINIKERAFTQFDSIDIKGVKVVRGIDTDSVLKRFHLEHKNRLSDSIHMEINWNQKETLDTLIINDFQRLTSKVVLSMTADTLNLKHIDSLFKSELDRKDLTVSYGLSFYQNKKINNSLHHKNIKDSALITTSKSSFLPRGSTLKAHFNNETKIILKRILSSILISTLLILAVISSLFYLLKIIKRQKQLAEIKNDLISNITHEFKTPIATIGVALESINSFNVINDKEKTKKYINMSSSQLSKLNLMVEKLLETATLDSGNLEFHKESIDIKNLIESLLIRYKTQHPNKIFSLNTKEESLLINIDAFHFENAINNILDNAVKYGGDTISLVLKTNQKTTSISISDNGNTLKPENKHRIFEKFYRIPKGNTHDIKGYGIGLYYTKTIIDKHSGNIALDLSDGQTTFKISLPNA